MHRRSFFVGLLTALALAAALPLLAAPVIDNNAGTWSDSYDENAGIASVIQTEVLSPPGIVRLENGQTTGSYTTSIIKPNSFGSWGSLALDANYSAPGAIQVEILDPLNGDAVISGPSNYTGPIDLSAINPVTYPDLRFRITLTAGDTRPTVSALNVTWTPKSALLINKQAPAEVQAGQQINYRINYSVAFVGATDLVVYDTIPAMTYPEDFGQDDNLTFVSATRGGQFTSSPITVKDVSIPANSVYWDLGNVPQGTSDVLMFTMKSKNGTLDGSVLTNTATAAAANATAATSAPVQTLIRSAPNPSLLKSAGDGTFRLASGNFTQPGAANTFNIQVRNPGTGSNNETMYETVAFDNLDSLTGKIDPDSGGPGIPVNGITPAAGQYTATPITINGVNVPANSVYWNVGTLPPGGVFNGRFSVKLLDAPPLTVPGSYTNTATVQSARTAPISSSLTVNYPLDINPYGTFGKGDGVGGTFRIAAARDDNRLVNDAAPPGPNNPFRYIKPGGVIPFALLAGNTGAVVLNDLVLLDKIPADTTFRSAWFTHPWLQANARIFYSTIDTANADTPHPYDVSEAPGDLDPAGEDNWESYATNPPANPADIKWIAFYIPAINSRFLNDSSPGWVPGAPTSATGYFDVNVSPTILDPNPCSDQFINNRGLFRVHASTPFEGGPAVALDPVLAAADDEPVLIAIDKPNLAFASVATVTPKIIDEPGPMAFTATATNNGTALATNVQLTLQWPQVPVNGVPQYLTLNGVNRPITALDPLNGTLTVSLGNLAPGASQSATLTVQVPAGIVFSQQINFTARASAAPAPCPVAEVVSTATATARFSPLLRVNKNDVADLIPSGGAIDYTITARNIGNAPTTNTWIVDRIPEETVFSSASGPQGEQVWFSQTENLPPSFLSPLSPIDATTIAANFTPGIRDDNGTPANFADDTWTSPFGDQTRWVAWLMDDSTLSPAIYPVGTIRTVGFRVINDADGSGPGTAGSIAGTQIFNSATIFSDELLQAIGNEVSSAILDSPGVLVTKTGPDYVTAGQQFDWTINYYNNSGGENDTTVITDTLPAGTTFVSATHTWNTVATANGAPVNNNAQIVPTSVTTNPNGTTTVVFQIASDPGSDGYRGSNTKLLTLEGGTIVITAQADSSLTSGTPLLNKVSGAASNPFGTITSRDEHETVIRNADVRINKLAQPPLPVSGDTVTYTLVAGNNGLVPAENVVLTDTLPVGMTYVPGSTLVLGSGATLAEPAISGQTLTWSIATANPITVTGNPPGTLPATSGDIFIQYQTTVDPGVPAGTDLNNVVTTTTDTPEDDTTNNQSDEEVRNPYPDPAVVKTGPAFVNPGDRFSYTIQYFNNTRQTAANVYLIDTLPDHTGDGETDLTFVSQSAPAGVTAYYSTAPTNAVPAFNPLDPTGSGDWTASPAGITNHIAWLVGTLPGEAGPFAITVTTDAIRPNNGNPILPPSGTELTNFVTIASSDPDEDSSNNQDDHTTRTPGNDIALIKTGSSEGSFPGLVPGAPITYTLEVINTGTEIAYGIEVVDTLPAGLTLASPSPGPPLLSLVNASGEPVQPVDGLGNPIDGDVPITVTTTGNTVTFQLGGASFRTTGLLPGQRQFLEINATVDLTVPNGTAISNSATAILRNQDDDDPEEQFLGNNTDDSSTVVYLPDVAIRKSVRDVPTGSEQWTEADNILEYTLEYNNLGFGPALDTVISEIVPAGTTLLNINNPPGTTVTTYADTDGRTSAFDVSMGTLPAPANLAGVIENDCLSAVLLTRLANNLNGIPAGSFLSGDRVGMRMAPLGDVNGDGIPDFAMTAETNDDGGSNAGGVWVVLLNADGTAQSTIELADGKNGIPAGSFLAEDRVGEAGQSNSSIAGVGDVNGDGIPDMVVSARLNDDGGSTAGGAWVILLNADGTAQSAIELANGKNGILPNSFAANDQFGAAVVSLGDLDGDGVNDLAISAPGNDDGGSSAGAIWIILLNADGTVKSAIEIANGKNGLPANTFPSNLFAAYNMSPLGDVNGDGVPDLLFGASFAGVNGAFILLLNADGTAQSAVRLSNGLNGIPPDLFSSTGVFATSPGDIDGDGVPDIALSYLTGLESSNSGGIWVILLNPDATAKSIVLLANGINGVPSGTFLSNEQFGLSIMPAGDVNNDGIPDLISSSAAISKDVNFSGGGWLVLLNHDGTAKNIIKIANGENGVPSNTFAASEQVGYSVIPLGDIGGTGASSFAFSSHNLTGGGAWVVSIDSVPCDGTSGDFASLLDGTNVTAGRLDNAIPFAGVKPGGAVALYNDTNGVPANAFLAGDQAGTRVTAIGDVDADGIPDVLITAPWNDAGALNAGAAWVMLMNADGTVKSAVLLTSGTNGIPAGAFLANETVGYGAASLGDLDGDGVPDIVLGANRIDGNRGGAHVILLNSDGTAKSTVKLADGTNGIPANTFLVGDLAGQSVANLGDIDGDGVQDIAISIHWADFSGLDAGGVLVVLLNSNGTAKSTMKLVHGANGIPAGSFASNDNVGWAVASLGDVNGDGVPDLGLSAHFNDDGGSNAGGAWVILLNPDGSALSAVQLADGLNGIPSGSFAASDYVGYDLDSIGDVDGDGVPDLLLSAHNNDVGAVNSGGAWVILLNTNGTAKSAVELANGLNGIPPAMFPGGSTSGFSVDAPGDLDGDGVPDLLVSTYAGGGVVVILLNPDGTAKSALRLANGLNGVPAGFFISTSGNSIDSIGDLDGDGLTEVLLGSSAQYSNAGGAYVLKLSQETLHETGSVEVSLAGNSGFQAWDRLFSAADLPDGTILSYTIGRRVNGVATYDLGSSWTEIPGPLPLEGLDISTLSEAALVVRVDFTTSQPIEPGALNPVLQSVFATYNSTTWPKFTFTVRVDDPVAANVLPDINNTVAIATSTPETDYSNNSAADDINLRTTDLEVVKTVDKASALETETVTFTLAWRNNGPQGAINTVLTDTLPAGLTFVSSTPAATSTNGQEITWTLGNLAAGSNGVITIETTVDAGTAGETLVNLAVISTDRQETTYANNQDDAPVFIGSLANVGITKTGPTTASLGGQVTYTLDYSNNGNNAAESVVLTDTLPAGLTFASASPAETSVSGQEVTWNLDTLAAGASGSITVTANVGTDYLALHNQTVLNLANITTTTPEVTLADNQDDHPVTLIGSPAVISGYVWNDRNGDAIRDAEELGLGGVTVTLTGTDVFGNPVTLTAQSAPDGTYSFVGINPSDATGYTITQTQPAEFLSTADVLGTVSGTPVGTNGDPLDNVIANILVNSGDRGIEYNFGEFQLGSISGFVSSDTTGDGLGDTPLPGVTLTLKDSSGNDIDSDPNTPGIQPTTTTTQADGSYLFDGLLEGDYQVVETQPAGYLSLSDIDGGDLDIIGDVSPINITQGLDVTGRNFIEVQPAIIGDFVFDDTNANGIQDAGETGLEGVTVTLFRPGFGPDGLPGTPDDDDPVAAVVTDIDGLYSFSVVPGIYQIGFDSLDGYVRTLADQGTDDALDSDPDRATGLTATFALAAGQTNDSLDAGYYQPASIGDFVFNDVNINGIQDAGETGLENVTITLFRPGFGPDGIPATADDADPVGVVETDVNGFYSFSVSPGTYRVGFGPLTDYNRTLANAGDDDGLDSDADATTGLTDTFVLAAGETNNTLDAGYYAPGTVSGTVRADTDNNGSGDTGLGGVPIALVNDQGATVATTTTNPDGTYLFEDVIPGTYTVVETQPEGYTSVSDVDGGDLDINGDQTPITVAPGQDVTGQDFTEVENGTISGTVLADTSGNGTGDAGLGGVPIALVDDQGATIATTTTNPDGTYLFENVIPGTYTVVETQPEGYTSVSDVDGGNLDINGDQTPITVAPGQDVTGQDFTEVENGTISGSVLADTTGDGLADTPVGGVSIALVNDQGATVETTTTAGDGSYGFLDVPPGIYTVVQTQPSGYLSLGDVDGGDLDINGDKTPITVDPGQDVTGQDFTEELAAGSIAGMVVDDINCDDLGDVGIPGVSLELLDGKTVVGTTLTEADGTYSFGGLAAGSYRVVKTPLTGYIGVSDVDGGDLDINGDVAPIVLANGSASVADQNFVDRFTDGFDPASDTDGDVFPPGQEYAFGGDPKSGNHLVKGFNYRAGMTISENPLSGGIDISYVRYASRYDVVVIPYVSHDPRNPINWTEVTAEPLVIDHGDGTETVKWENIHDIDDNPLVDRDTGFVRLYVDPCHLEPSWTLVQGWDRVLIEGKRQTHGRNFSSMPVFTGFVDAAWGSTITTTSSGKGENLGSYLAGGAPLYYLELTDGPGEGHRFDLLGGGVDTFVVNLASRHNTLAALPANLAGSHYVIRRHETLGEIYPNAKWDANTSFGDADQVLFYDDSGYTTYYNLSLTGTWVRHGGGFGSRNGLIVPPGTGMLVVHANPNDVNEVLQFGDLRYNDFKRPLHLGSAGLNFTAQGYPFDATPAQLRMTIPNGFAGAFSFGEATQILNWAGDTVINAPGWTTNFLLALGENGSWRTQGSISTVTNDSFLFRHARAAHVDVQQDKTDWTHDLPWDPIPWVQPGR